MNTYEFAGEAALGAHSVEGGTEPPRKGLRAIASRLVRHLHPRPATVTVPEKTT